MLDETIKAKAHSAKEASRALYTLSSTRKNRLLRAIAGQLRAHTAQILDANRHDLERAAASGLSTTLLDRLRLDERRIRQMIAGVNAVIRLPDPVGTVVDRARRPNGLRIERQRVPLGAVGIIYEARPNVTIDASVLCLKAGNAVLLKGGSEALETNKELVQSVKAALCSCGLPEGCVEFIDVTDRQAVLVMIAQQHHLDVVIPRGSQQLIKFIQEHAAVPVIAHGEGNCHVYVDSPADLAMAEAIAYNAKVQRPSVCNAAEKLLIHRKVAPAFLPKAVQRLRDAGVEIRGDEESRSLADAILPASEADWSTEYLDLIIAIKIVGSLDEAITHIGRYGSHHSDAIVTASKSHGERFLREVDSAAVYVNASTRFTDGHEFGLGAEIGISTQKLHARGPMGLAELTSVKFVVRGRGQVRA